MSRGPLPYIGVTGIMSERQAAATIEVWRETWRERGTRDEPTHALMLGVLMSEKTLHGIENKYPLRYPKREHVRGIINACVAENVIPAVHYAGDKSLDNLSKLQELAGPCCEAIQFNGVWPHPGRIPTPPWPRIVMQARPEDSASLAVMAGSYRELVTDIVLDGSGGKGIPMRPDELAWDALRVFAHRSLYRGFVGVAGGLDGSFIRGHSAVGKLLRAGLSIDAETRLRDDDEGGGNLDLDKVQRYLAAAIEELNQ